MTDYEIPGESAWAGKTLAELNFGKRYGVHVVSILRGRKRINIPGASVRLFPQDKIQVIATDEELTVFGEEMNKISTVDADAIEKSETILRQLRIDANSPFLGKNLERSRYPGKIPLSDCRCGTGEKKRYTLLMCMSLCGGGMWYGLLAKVLMCTNWLVKMMKISTYNIKKNNYLCSVNIN